MGIRNRRIPAIELIEEVPGLPKAIDGGLGRSQMRAAVVCLAEIDPREDLGLGLLAAMSNAVDKDALPRLAEGTAAFEFEQAQRIAGIVALGMLSGPTMKAWMGIGKTAGYDFENADFRWLRHRVQNATVCGAIAKSVLKVLDSRGLKASERVRRYVLTNDNERELYRLFDEAFTAEDAETLASPFYQ